MTCWKLGYEFLYRDKPYMYSYSCNETLTVSEKVKKMETTGMFQIISDNFNASANTASVGGREV